MKNAGKRRVFDIIQIGNTGDLASRMFDLASVVMILANLCIAVIDTFPVPPQLRAVLNVVELITVLAFTLEYVLRVWTAEYLYPHKSRENAVLSYMLSFNGIVDLLSFFPYYLPVFFPMGAVAFRIFRIVRILRLFRVNAYYDALNVITGVVKSKKDQLISSVFIIFVLMMASSLCMYSLEHEAQPQVFQNAFSGFWWSVSTLLTVGYGDIYPITPLGRLFGIFITFLGVGMVAIPTGILSAGFVSQYSQMKELGSAAQDSLVQFVRLIIDDAHEWKDRRIDALPLPAGLYPALVQRGGTVLLPHGEVQLQAGDHLILAAAGYPEDAAVSLKEIHLKEHHPWIGMAVKNLDISRQEFIVMIRRDGQVLVPDGGTRLRQDDLAVLYTRRPLLDAQEVTV